MSRSEAAKPPAQPRRRLPGWLKRPIPLGTDFTYTDRLLAECGLETVCREAICPNRSECWSRRSAAFMILGRICTRGCGFCAVQRGRPEPIDAAEPRRLADAVSRLGLRHVVITAVARDDLADGGADHFRRCALAVRERSGAAIELLTPDFAGRSECLDVVLAAEPEVFNHNLETVCRLQEQVRRKASYRTSLRVLDYVKRRRPEIATKSGLMLGLGETTAELLEALADLRAVGCNLLTIGQYLQPTPRHLPVERFVPPAVFAELGELAESMGFEHVASGPFVRSSFHAAEMTR